MEHIRLSQVYAALGAVSDLAKSGADSSIVYPAADHAHKLVSEWVKQTVACVPVAKSEGKTSNIRVSQ